MQCSLKCTYLQRPSPTTALCYPFFQAAWSLWHSCVPSLHVIEQFADLETASPRQKASIIIRFQESPTSAGIPTFCSMMTDPLSQGSASLCPRNDYWPFLATTLKCVNWRYGCCQGSQYELQPAELFPDTLFETNGTSLYKVAHAYSWSATTLK